VKEVDDELSTLITQKYYTLEEAQLFDKAFKAAKLVLFNAYYGITNPTEIDPDSNATQDEQAVEEQHDAELGKPFETDKPPNASKAARKPTPEETLRTDIMSAVNNAGLNVVEGFNRASKTEGFVGVVLWEGPDLATTLKEFEKVMNDAGFVCKNIGKTTGGLGGLRGYAEVGRSPNTDTKTSKVADMKTIPPSSGQMHEILDTVRTVLGVGPEEPLWKKYLTYSEGGSNKFHYFAVFKSEGFVAANAYGRIGYPPQVSVIGKFDTKEDAVGAAEDKMAAKVKKGYDIVNF
jgi:predicted DNA-binding WGR domain protein